MGVRKRTTIRGQHIDVQSRAKLCQKRQAARLCVYIQRYTSFETVFFHEKVVDTWENMDYTKFNLKS